jgi:hypothetical protein
MENREDFDAAWDQIKQTAPDTFVQYLEETWMKDEVVAMWSAVYRGSRSIFEMCDTNMLVEAYVIYLSPSIC